jgi:hypothetical protein
MTKLTETLLMTIILKMTLLKPTLPLLITKNEGEMIYIFMNNSLLYL